MAQRLATEYVQTCLQLTHREMYRFMELIDAHQLTMQVKILDNGNMELVVQDNSHSEMQFVFEHQLGGYQFRGSCRLASEDFVKMMRNAVARFKGHAVVHRIYPRFKMVYEYQQGKVTKIIEVRESQEVVIYEQTQAVHQFEVVWSHQHIEQEINQLRAEIDDLLTNRWQSYDQAEIDQIDFQLKYLSYRLWMYEA